MSLLNRILYLINMLTLFALALSYLAPYISPTTFLWPIAFLGLVLSNITINQPCFYNILDYLLQKTLLEQFLNYLNWMWTSQYSLQHRK